MLADLHFFFLEAGVGALTTSPLEKWDEVIDVNIKAAMRLIHYCLPHLEAAAKAGKLPAVLNIGSLSAKGHFGGYVPCTYRPCTLFFC